MNHSGTDSVICPYCDEELSDSDRLEEGDIECDKCKEVFYMSAYRTVKYFTGKFPCAGSHQWGNPRMVFFGSGSTRTCEKCDLYELVEHMPEGVKL